MLGPFLWGRRAQTRLLDVQEDEGGVTVRAQTKYGAIRHTRTLRFDKMRTLTVEDAVEGAQAADARKNFRLRPTYAFGSNGIDARRKTRTVP